MKRIADSTVRRLSLYLRFLEDFEQRGLETISSDELARRGGTTSAQVRKDLSFFGSFGKRGLGYSVAELSTHDNQRVTKALNDGLQAALTGSKTPADAMRDAQREATRLLRSYKR